MKKVCFLFVFLFCSAVVAEDRNLYEVVGSNIILRNAIGSFDVWSVTKNSDGTVTYVIQATEDELFLLNGYDVNISMKLTAIELKGAMAEIDRSIYHTYDEVIAFLNEIETDHTNIAKVYDIGSSIDGRPIKALKISSSPTYNHPDKTEVVFVSMHHAKEWPTLEFAIALAEELTGKYNTDPYVTSMVNDSEIWIIPLINPDGYVFSYNENGAEGNVWRKNRREIPFNGSVTYGVDLNRNYSYRWTPTPEGPFIETYSGSSAFSEPETTALRRLIGDQSLPADDNLGYMDSCDGLISYHTKGSKILYPYSYDEVQPETLNELLLIGNQMAEMSGYKLLISSDPVEMYPSSGDTADWFYVNSGFKPAFTVEMRPSTTYTSFPFILDENELELAINENL
ncbi:MAG TPA: M14 family metallopeptidase, partial [bacterium]|nr:M14 family metallopeptidase [bacterium]